MGAYDQSPSLIIEDIEKTEHRVLDGERIRDEMTANRRGAQIKAFERGQIQKFEERPLVLILNID